MHKIKRTDPASGDFASPLSKGFAFWTVLPKSHDQMSLIFLHLAVGKVKWLIHLYDTQKKPFISDADIQTTLPTTHHQNLMFKCFWKISLLKSTKKLFSSTEQAQM